MIGPSQLRRIVILHLGARVLRMEQNLHRRNQSIHNLQASSAIDFTIPRKPMIAT